MGCEGDSRVTRPALAALDAADPLGALREAFALPEGLIYLDGNSLGALPRATAGRVADLVTRQWGRDLIGSWNAHAWIDAPARIGAKIAPLIGAAADEVVVADSVSVNLFKLACGALDLRPGRRILLAEAGNFPTDLYILRGIERLLQGRAQVRTCSRDALAGAIDDDTAAVILTETHYKSAERWPMAEITAAAHSRGALAIWDLSHSAGALSVDLNGVDADLAVGCGYKYLSGGPGAPSFLYVAKRWHGLFASPLWGWMGHAAPFDFAEGYAAAPGITGGLCGTPGMLGMAALEAGVDLFHGLNMTVVEAKARALGDTFIALTEARCDVAGLALASPRDGARRGGHVSFRHPHGYAIIQALIARGVIGDFRSPDILRFGFAPLYVRHVDVWDAVEALRQVLDSGEYRQPRFGRRATVT